MTEQECLAKMVAPGTRRSGKYREGVIQIHVTRACDNACFNCTQGSNLGGRTEFIPLDHFRRAVDSLAGYFGVVGVFGGNPALHPQFPALCGILRERVPLDQCGLWCNSPQGHGKVMRETFDPKISNLNCHLSQAAYDEFKRDWPESMPFGHDKDSRHSPCYVAMKDVLKIKRVVHADGGDCHGTPLVDGKCPKCGIHPDMQSTEIWPFYDESRAWELISDCDINKHWSAMIGVFRGELRAWFCEIAGAQAMLHQYEPDYPDTGIDPAPIYDMVLGDGPRFKKWWESPMGCFADQVRKHCHSCSVPLKGNGELAMSDDGKEQVSITHAGVYKLKRKGRQLEVVTDLIQLGIPLHRMTDYLKNASR